METALYKGTLRDRANSGALLFQSNPLPNLDALDVVIGLTKTANKANTDVIDIICELFTSAIIPSNRKLYSLQQRGIAFRKLKADSKLEKSYKEKVYLYWYFESELKDRYHTFLQNLDSALKSGQDVHKNQGIVCAAKLLAHGPEKEQMILSTLVNKMGDPQPKVAAKAQYQLTEVCHQHPNMCEVMVAETDRFLFRPNLSERAQHVALTFLSEISPICNPKACRRLIQLCFLFFKILVDKGLVNNKTMQAILRCLRRAVANVEQKEGDREIISKDLQNIIYRLIYFADIQIAIQALGLLLQVYVTPGQPTNPNKDRFYTALYRKMIDIRIASMTQKWTAQYLYIIHRAIALDPDVVRAKAFIKRLLQIGLYMPAPAVCGILIIVSKILLDRPQIAVLVKSPTAEDLVKLETKQKMLNDDSDEEEHYEDVEDERKNQPKGKKNKDKKSTGSWTFAKVKKEEEDGVKKEEDGGVKKEVLEDKPHKAPKIAVQYDHFFRNPAGAGAQYVELLELIRVQAQFHPTVQKFCDAIIADKRIDYYGDPLMDFSLTRFLDRFAFKNPKKEAEEQKEIRSVVQAKHAKSKDYKQHGSRGLSVNALTDRNCTEDERFIFQYLERQRQIRGKKDAGEDSESDQGDLDDDEFDSYLDGLGAKRMDDDEEVDFMKEMSGLPDMGGDKAEGKTKKRKKGAAEDDEEAEDDWNDGEPEGDDDVSDVSMNGDDISDLSDLGDDSDDEEGAMTFSESDGDEEDGGRKDKGMVSEKEFNRKLKNSADMSSLFAAADDFGELLEATGKIKKHGTTDEVSTKDRAGEKQLAWEQNRHKGAGGKSRNMGKATLKNKSKKFKK